eukprot:scaffold5766_cov256-Pinguiococcus_pyrenoidosus.AAC.9
MPELKLRKLAPRTPPEARFALGQSLIQHPHAVLADGIVVETARCVIRRGHNRQATPESRVDGDAPEERIVAELGILRNTETAYEVQDSPRRHVLRLQDQGPGSTGAPGKAVRGVLAISLALPRIFNPLQGVPERQAAAGEVIRRLEQPRRAAGDPAELRWRAQAKARRGHQQEQKP